MIFIIKSKDKRVVSYIAQVNSLLKSLKIEPETALTLTMLTLEHLLDKEILPTQNGENIEFIARKFN